MSTRGSDSLDRRDSVAGSSPKSPHSFGNLNPDRLSHLGQGAEDAPRRMVTHIPSAATRGLPQTDPGHVHHGRFWRWIIQPILLLLHEISEVFHRIIHSFHHTNTDAIQPFPYQVRQQSTSILPVLGDGSTILTPSTAIPSTPERPQHPSPQESERFSQYMHTALGVEFPSTPPQLVTEQVQLLCDGYEVSEGDIRGLQETSPTSVSDTGLRMLALEQIIRRQAGIIAKTQIDLDTAQAVDRFVRHAIASPQINRSLAPHVMRERFSTGAAVIELVVDTTSGRAFFKNEEDNLIGRGATRAAVVGHEYFSGREVVLLKPIEKLRMTPRIIPSPSDMSRADELVSDSSYQTVIIRDDTTEGAQDTSMGSYQTVIVRDDATAVTGGGVNPDGAGDHNDLEDDDDATFYTAHSEYSHDVAHDAQDIENASSDDDATFYTARSFISKPVRDVDSPDNTYFEPTTGSVRESLDSTSISSQGDSPEFSPSDLHGLGQASDEAMDTVIIRRSKKKHSTPPLQKAIAYACNLAPAINVHEQILSQGQSALVGLSDVERESFIIQDLHGLPGLMETLLIDDEKGEMYQERFEELGRRLKAGHLELREGLPLIAQIATGLEHTHAKGFIHRDLKPSNLLFNDEGKAVISDFGSACHERGDPYKLMFCSTPGYTSVESARAMFSQEDALNLTRASDIWAMGVILFEMFIGEPLELPIFKLADNPRVFQSPWGHMGYCSTFCLTNKSEVALRRQKAYQDTYLEPRDKESLEHLIWSCLRLDPLERPSATNLRKALDRLAVCSLSPPLGA